MVGRINNDVDMNALEEELAVLMLQDNGEPLSPQYTKLTWTVGSLVKKYHVP